MNASCWSGWKQTHMRTCCIQVQDQRVGDRTAVCALLCVRAAGVHPLRPAIRNPVRCEWRSNMRTLRMAAGSNVFVPWLADLRSANTYLHIVRSAHPPKHFSNQTCLQLCGGLPAPPLLGATVPNAGAPCRGRRHCTGSVWLWHRLLWNTAYSPTHGQLTCSAG